MGLAYEGDGRVDFRPSINLERGVDFEADSGPGYRREATTIKYYLCGRCVVKVAWEMLDFEVRCRLLEADGETISATSEWFSVDQVRTGLDQKQLLCATVKQAGITTVGVIREIPENVYLEMAHLNELAKLIK